MLDILQVHHVTVLSAGTQAPTESYENILGPRTDSGLGSSSPDFAHLSLATAQQAHFREGTAPPHVGQHFCLEVADIRQAVGNCNQLPCKYGCPKPDCGISVISSIHPVTT